MVKNVHEIAIHCHSLMQTGFFLDQRLIGRETELRRLCQILVEDGDCLLVGAPGIGRRSLIRAAAQQMGVRVIEIDCFRSTSPTRFLRLLADSITEVFSELTELRLLQTWIQPHPIVLEQPAGQRAHLTWHLPIEDEWTLFQTLLDLPQFMADALNCRVVILFLNFPHIRSWDRSGHWESHLRQAIQQQSRVSYTLVASVVEAWAEESDLHIIALSPLDPAIMQDWIVPAMAAEGFQFTPEALKLFLEIVQGHIGDAISLAQRIWLETRIRAAASDWTPPKEPAGALIEAHHVHRSVIALVNDLSTTFESLILLLPPSQVRVLESLALDPTDRPQAREYIQKHQLTRGGSLQGALASLEQKGLLYGQAGGYRVALPFLAFWLRSRLG